MVEISQRRTWSHDQLAIPKYFLVQQSASVIMEHDHLRNDLFCQKAGASSYATPAAIDPVFLSSLL